MTTAKGLPKEVIAAVRSLEADSACEHSEINEDELMAFKVYDDRVVLVIASGQKYEVPRVGLLDLVKKAVSRKRDAAGPPETDQAK